MVQWCLVVLYLVQIYIDQSEYVSMVGRIRTREVALYFDFKGEVVRPRKIF